MKKNKFISLLGIVSLFAGVSSCTKNNNNSNNTNTSTISSTPISIPTSTSTNVERTTDASSFTYEITTSNRNKIIITGLKDPNYAHIVIPDEIDGKKVIGISNSALQNNPNIKTLYLNRYLDLGIGHYPTGDHLSGCTNLEKIDISEENENFYVKGNCLIGKESDESDTQTLYFGFKNSIKGFPIQLTIQGQEL